MAILWVEFFMIDVSDFFRVKEHRLEVLILGLAMEFYLYAEQQGYNKTTKRQDRAKWISEKIIEYLDTSYIQLIVLDCRKESYTNYMAKDVLDILATKIDKQVLVLTSTDPKDIFQNYDYKIDRLGDIDTFFFYSNLIQRNINWLDIEIDIPIISLVGRPTVQRATITKKLADLCQDKIRISFGNLTNTPINSEESGTYANILDPYPFPFLQHTDDKFEQYPLDMQDYVGYNLFQSLVAIVHESHDFNNENIQLSEKSFKHFAWHQIPIFNASKGHIEVVRSLGFDLFDDIIDHSYDVAPNSHLQELRILNVVAKFLKDYPTLEDVNKLRKHIFPRLQANNELLRKFNQERVYEPWPYYG